MSKANKKKGKGAPQPTADVASAAGAWARPAAPNVPTPRPAAPNAARGIPQPAASAAPPGGAWARPAAPNAPAACAWATPAAAKAPAASAWPKPTLSNAPATRPAAPIAPPSEPKGQAAPPKVVPAPANKPQPGDGGARPRGQLRDAGRQRNENMEIVKTKPPSVNQKQGTKGQPLQLYTNYFRLFSKIDWEVYHYRVDFEPPVEYGKALMARLKQAQTLPLGGYLFDGTSLFLTKKLSQEDKPIELTMQNNEAMPIKVTVKLVGIVSKHESQFLQILNIIMKHAMSALKLEKVGHRDYFDPAAKISIRNHGIELWPGYTTSIRQHEKEILMLAEIKHKLIRQETCMAILNDCYNSDRNNFNRKFEELVLGMTVMTAYNNKTYRISEVNWNLTPNSTFDGRNGEKIAYMQYYRTKYNITILNDRQPLLICRPKDRDLRGGIKEIALVPELCFTTGYTDAMRNNFHLMRAVAEHTRVEPSARIQKLLAFNQRIRNTVDSVAQLNNWHLNMEQNLMKLNGRVLPAQEIKFNGKTERYANVNWQQAFRDHKMFASAKLDAWYFMYPKRVEREARNFSDCLMRAAKGMQFAIGTPRMMEMPDDRLTTLNTHIEECCKHNPRLILTLLTSSAADKYTTIKRRCYNMRGVASQVVLLKTIGDPKKTMSVATKVAIQINAKLGGAPWMISIPTPSLMTIGYDVYHDSSDKSRSYGALVATMDLNDQTKSPGFFSTVSSHRNGEELSNNFAMMVVKALEAYKARHRHIPARIIIYRDGVGEGQTNYVYEHELKHLVQTLKGMYKETPLKMAFVVVSKRINTKFFTVGERAANPPPGTVVDDVVTLPERYDFFLVSQSVNQGTATPTNYNVLYDTFGVTPDQLQDFTYRMCHLYYNWSGTTRVPATCQYAHKLAFLVGQYLHAAPAANLDQTLYFL